MSRLEQHVLPFPLEEKQKFSVLEIHAQKQVCFSLDHCKYIAISCSPVTENAFFFPSSLSGYVHSGDTALCTLSAPGEHKFQSSCKRALKQKQAIN